MLWMLFLIGAGALPAGAEQVTFRVADPLGRNLVRFESRAPLETVAGTTNRIQGTVRVDPDDLLAAPHAEFEVDLAGLDTGIALRNEHMRVQYLEVETHPKAGFRLDRIEAASRGRLADGEAVEMRGVGALSLHGVTRRLPVEVRAVYIRESEETRQKLPGNLLRIEAGFRLRLGDFDIPVPKLVALQLDEVVTVSIDVLATDAPLEAGADTSRAEPGGQ